MTALPTTPLPAPPSSTEQPDAIPPPVRPDAEVATGLRALPRPRPPRLRMAELAAALVGFTAVTIGIWAVPGGAGELTRGWASAWTSLARISGLLASAVGLVGLVLVARLRSIERRAGLDRLFVWHKWLGGTMAVLVAVHVVAGLVAWSDGQGWWQAAVELTGRQPYMAAATVGALLLTVVTVSSMHSVRRRLSYETWWFVHLTAYAALALAFGHEVVLGGDLAGGGPAWWFWVTVHLAVIAALIVGRWGPTLRSALAPLRVEHVEAVAPGTVELTLGGRRLRGLEAESGQFAILRPLVGRLWWQAHPFSLSAEPTSAGLTFTIKDRGDASSAMTALPVGTRVAVEGPFGVLTADVLDPDRRLVLIVGGVGVAPARALLQRLAMGVTAGDAPVVLFRARTAAELVHEDDLRALAAQHGGRVLTLVGRTAALAVADPFAAPSLRSVIPDLAERQAFVCGPDRLVAAARSGLRAAGVPRNRIHFERSWW